VRPYPGYTSPALDVRAQRRIDFKVHPRRIIGWNMIGSHYTPRGQRVPGALRLLLNGGGWLYYPEGTTLDQAYDDADDLGVSTQGQRERDREWVRTGRMPADPEGFA
jgi:hypothetical protein